MLLRRSLSVAAAAIVLSLSRASTSSISIMSSFSSSSLPSLMRVVELRGTGDSSVLDLVQRPLPLSLSASASPSLGPRDLLVRTSFAGVNFIDTYHRSGVYPLRSNVIGMEGAGTVVACGDAVPPAFSARLAQTEGEGLLVAWPATISSYAEYVVVPFDRVVTVPQGVALDVACAAMLQGMTAHYLVTSVFPVKEGDVVLVHAAAGGVGQILTQMAKARGAKVIATCGSEEKAALARELGADHVIVGYDNVAAKARELNGGKGVDVVYDGVGKDTFIASLDSLRPRGMMALYGGASGQVPPFDLQGLNTRGSLFVTRPKLADFIATADELQWRAKEIFDDIQSGKLKLSIGGIYPIEDVRRSHDDLEGRKTTGKLLLKF